jgi:hypothetical protein
LKRNIKEWEALRTQYLVEQRQTRAGRNDARRRQKRRLEAEIERLESRPSNAGRARAVALLRKELRRGG